MAASAAEACSEKAAYWSEHIAAWQRSGLSQGAYCRRHGLSQSSLSYWRKRVGATNDGEVASFVTIVPVPLLGNRSIRPFLRRLSFLSWFIPQEDDHGHISNRGMFREGGVLV